MEIHVPDDCTQFVLSIAPFSTNTVIGSKKGAGHAALKKWKVAAGWELKTVKPHPVAGSYGLMIEWNPNETDIDIDNGVKAVADLLEWMRYTDNDRNMVRLVVGLDSSIDGAMRIRYWPENRARKEW